MDKETTSHTPESWDAELKAMSDRLSRESRRSGIIGFLGGVVVMGGVGLMVLATMNAKQQLSTQVTVNQDLTHEVQKKDLQVTTAQKQAKAAIAVYGATVENLQPSKNPAVAAAVEKAFDADPTAAGLIARVYIHIHSEQQRPQAEIAARTLRSAGYIVPGIDLKPETARQSEVHYYAADSQSVADADAIIKALASAGVTVGKRQVPQATSDKLRPRAYGLWLAPGP
jgi:hypothetical protein